MEGGPARDAHKFANAQWGYIVKKQATAWGRFIDKNIPDAVDIPRRARVTISEFPEQTTKGAEFPPKYHEKKIVMRRGLEKKMDPDYVPVITMGRYGCLLKKARPSDDAFEAMFKSAKKVIRLALQDIGPVALPGTKHALPGMTWPMKYLDALAFAIWDQGIDVEIVLSNPASIPGDLSPLEANYGNGWDCVDVAAEIIKHVKKFHPDAKDVQLRSKLSTSLRICFLRSPAGNHYKDGQTLGLHCTYALCLCVGFCWSFIVFIAGNSHEKYRWSQIYYSQALYR